MNNYLDYKGILEQLPHRFPFLLLDKITEFDPAKRIKGVKNISHYEPMLTEPEATYYPSGLVLEAIGQLGVLLFNKSREAQTIEDFLLGSVVNVELIKDIPFGCQLELEATVIKMLENEVIYSGSAMVNGDLVLTVEYMVAATHR